MLAVFDFDHTIVDENSDVVACDKINPPNLIPDIKNYRNNWTGYMQKVFDTLKSINIPAEQILNAVSLMTPVEGIPKLIRLLHKNNVDIIVASDSNSLFIHKWLEQNELSDIVPYVYTNPAKIEDNLIKIEPYTQQTTCNRCTMNMCKSAIMKEHITLKTNKTYHKLLYFGDGRNDLCPILNLTQNDIAFPRSGYTLENLLKLHATQAEVVTWCKGDNICEYLISSNLITVYNV